LRAASPRSRIDAPHIRAAGKEDGSILPFDQRIILRIIILRSAVPGFTQRAISSRPMATVSDGGTL
jgi:hypothetical protein